MKTEQSWFQQSFSTNTFKVKGQSSLHWAEGNVSAMLIVTMYCGYICHLSARWDNSMTAGYCWTRRVLLLPVFIRFYLWRPTWVLDIWNEDMVCEDVRRVASFSGPALRTCLGFKGRTFSSDVKTQSEGMDGGPERSNCKQRKVLQKADKTQRCFWGHINVTDQMT